MIERSEIEHSVILDDSRIIGAGRIEDSLLGHHVEVRAPSAGPEPPGSWSATTARSTWLTDLTGTGPPRAGAAQPYARALS